MNAPRTVYFLIDELEVWGGTETHLFRLLSALDPRRFRPIVGIIGKSSLACSFREQGIHAEALHIDRTLAPSGIIGLFKIARLLRSHDAKLLVTYHTAADLLGPVAALPVRVPVLSCRRDDGFTKKPIHLQLQRRINTGLHGMICVSDYVAQRVHQTETFPRSKMRVIWNGEDLQTFCPGPSSARQALGLEPKDLVLTCVGSLTPVKDHLTLLQGFCSFSQQEPRARLLLVGDGPCRTQLEIQIHELGLETKVYLLGARRDVSSILKASDLYVQTSLTEGFSNAIVQALATALPVVATSVGGNAELIVPECGRLIPKQQPRALAEALAELSSSPELRQRMGAAARAHSLSRCSLDRMVEAYGLEFDAAMHCRAKR